MLDSLYPKYYLAPAVDTYEEDTEDTSEDYPIEEDMPTDKTVEYPKIPVKPTTIIPLKPTTTVAYPKTVEKPTTVVYPKSKSVSVYPKTVEKPATVEKSETKQFTNTAVKTTKFESVAKNIRSVIIPRKPINPRGETRCITVNGSVGSMFTMTVKTASGCSVLEEEIENVTIPDSGIYRFCVEFPKLDASAKSETFTLEFLPSADTKSGIYMEFPKSLEKIIADFTKKEQEDARKPFPIATSTIQTTTELYQYKNPTVTFTNTSSQTSPALAATGSDVTKTGNAKTKTENLAGYSTSTYTLAIVEDPDDTAGVLYVKPNQTFRDNVTNNTTIKKIVRRETSGENTITRSLRLDPSTTITDADGIITGDLTTGMRVTGGVSYTKTVVSRVGTTNCNILVSEFKLDNTNDLFEGMIVTGRGIYKYPITVTKVDCSDSIVTLSSKQKIQDNTVLTFRHDIGTSIRKVHTNIDPDGRACIELNAPIIVPDRVQLSFDADKTVVDGAMKHSGSGTNSITLTTEVDVIKFGAQDVTYTLDLDGIITKTPNANSQDVIVKKDTATSIYLLGVDTDANASSKTATVVANPSHGGMGSWDADTKSIRYTPHTGFTGTDSFTFTLSDGTNSSDEKRINITVS